MRVEALRHQDPVDGAVGLEEDLALGQVEIERLRGPAAAFLMIS